MTKAKQQKPQTKPNEKPKGGGLVSVGLISIAIFAMVILAAVLQHKAEDPQATILAQQKWAKNDLLLNSLQRYTDVYQKLDNDTKKQALALGYVQHITKDLLMFPAKDSASIRVVLPQKAEDNTTVMVLKEISLGTSDNGLFKAFRVVLDAEQRSASYNPPVYIEEVVVLLEYVVTGEVRVVEGVE
jgi:hypothetical protein